MLYVYFLLFRNTSLQCLLHSKFFIQLFLKEISTNPVKKDSSAYYFHNLICKVSSNPSSIAPSDFKSFFARKHKLFSGYSQHDSQEFLRHLLEDISLDMNRVKNMPKYKELETKGKSKLKLNEDFHNLFLKREDSVVLDAFQGQFCNTFECENCNFNSYSFEKFIDLPILLGNSVIIIENNVSKNLSLEFLLQKHFQDDRFEWSSKCDSCGKRTMHTKRIRISILPQTLVVCFQRYNPFSGKKNNSKISFPERVNISQYVDYECLNLRNSVTQYKLYAISNHSGSLNFGHYYAYFVFYPATVMSIRIGRNLTILRYSRSEGLHQRVRMSMCFFTKG